MSSQSQRSRLFQQYDCNPHKQEYLPRRSFQKHHFPNLGRMFQQKWNLCLPSFFSLKHVSLNMPTTPRRYPTPSVSLLFSRGKYQCIPLIALPESVSLNTNRVNSSTHPDQRWIIHAIGVIHVIDLKGICLYYIFYFKT
jgi:hypothetical protein